MARGGRLNADLLEKLNHLEYYRRPYPKSIGYEWFVKKGIPIINSTNDSLENLLHTGIHHIAEQIAVQVMVNSRQSVSSLLVTGGGALNEFLIQTLWEKLGAGTKVTVPDRQLIEFKEALVFAFMAVLRMERKTNVLHSVTGADRDSSSGVVYLPS